jgi:hypothetical protein
VFFFSAAAAEQVSANAYVHIEGYLISPVAVCLIEPSQDFKAFDYLQLYGRELSQAR